MTAADTSQIELQVQQGSVSVDAAALPRHVAIIMDGNGRWAQQKGWTRVFGHENGVEAVRSVTTEAARLNLERLTLYAFSSENWSRPKKEITILFRLLSNFLVAERPTLMENNIRLTSIGEIERLPEHTIKTLRETERLTRDNTGLTLCLALSYGARKEIVSATRAIAEKVKQGILEVESITEEVIQEHFYAPDAVDPDLLIRTAGEMRISNFLLWQISYSEIYVTEVYWPEFQLSEFHQALYEYTRRKRRFGGLE